METPTPDDLKKKILSAENIAKGIFTSILGATAIMAAGYGWWVDQLSDWQGGGLALVGWVAMFMRDEVPGFISQFFTAVLKKFGGGA